MEAGNYKTILDLLKATYGAEEQIKLAHVMDFIKMPEISHTTQDLAEFRASMDQHTVALKNHKLTLEEFQTICLYSKLPPKLREVFKRDLGANCMNYKIFADKVTNELENLRLSERVSGIQASKKQPLSSIASFGVQQSSRRSTSILNCRLCTQKHV